MQDSELIEKFENYSLPLKVFNHQTHLRITWIYLKNYPYNLALKKINQGIIQYAAHHGLSNVYKKDLTEQWFNAIYNAFQIYSGQNFDDFIHKHSHLLSKNFI